MKRLERLMVLMLAVCLAVPMFSNMAWAAEGTLQFTDPTTAVGQNVDVTVKIDAAGEAIGDGNVTVSYDPAVLQFVSGTNATGADGTANLAASGTGTETELTYTMTFTALAEGETKLTVSDYTAYLYNNDSLNLTLGESTVTIGAGDGTSAAGDNGSNGQITVDGKNYTIDSNFSDAVIPEGFQKTTMTYNGTEVSVIQQDASGQYMMYLDDGATKDFFLYDEETDKFTISELVDISDSAYIILLQKDDTVTIPNGFEETELTLNNKVFPTWQNTEYPAYYLVYALNNTGEKRLYQYDTQDGTYQRYNEDTTENTTVTTAKTKLDKLLEVVKKNFKIIAITAAAVLVLLLLLLIILAVKLHSRNLEIDDLYEEYHIDDQMGIDKPIMDRKKKKKAVNDFDDDELDDEDAYRIGEGESESEEDMLEDVAEIEDDDFIEDTEPELSPILEPKKKWGHKKKKIDQDDDIDFLDLD